MSLFMIDEPDIYLHADLQRQLLGILKGLGPDILIATHSTELISESDAGDLVVVNKGRKSGERIKDPSELQYVFKNLGSNLNPILTQLAKTGRALFVEGQDFQIFSRFARKLGLEHVANRSHFAVVPANGFNPGMVRDFTRGMETTLGERVLVAVIFDRDYRSPQECEAELASLRRFCQMSHIHSRKEIENFLFVTDPLRRAIDRRLSERNRRTGERLLFEQDVLDLLMSLTDELRHRVQARYMGRQRQYEKSLRTGRDDSTIEESLLRDFDSVWGDPDQRLLILPGKETLSILNSYLQENCGITVSAGLIVDSFQAEEIPREMVNLLDDISSFGSLSKEESSS